MNKLLINRKSEESLISGYNFARRSNVVFSEILTHNQYSKITDKENISVVFKEKDLICYIRNNLNIQENDIIFCTTYFVLNILY